VDVRFFERIEPVARLEVLRRLSLPDQFFLFVGTLQPRKNLERAIDAHAALPAAMQAEVPLVII
jgi:alpha-1,3-rhamnosyl/mannosyltransferase